MNRHDFFWSGTSSARYYRHIAFWVVIYAFFLLSVWMGFLTRESYQFSDMLPRFRSRFFVLLTCMAYNYIVVYFLIPKFLYRKAYLLFTVFVIGSTMVSYAGTAYIMHTSTEIFKKSTLVYAMWIHTMNFLFLGPPVVCGLFLAGKMIRSYFKKMEEKVVLVKENANAELQFLKAQVHPHFLFNTLNNIYSFTLSGSPEASGLVTKLSDMLRYMTDECEYPLVPLAKELKVLRDYIDLEKIRYGNLKLKVDIVGECDNKLIAPLILIPFVENSFKHGSSKMLQDPWIDLFISVDDDLLLFSLNNSRPDVPQKQNAENGIGLTNVKKRLQLLYPGRYELTIAENKDSFSVRLKLPLHLSPSGTEAEIQAVAEVL
ncbi:MAG TPA: histidine kinase [Sphingobacteriaceae bacterium]